MKAIAWLVLIASLIGIVVLLARMRARWQEQKRVAQGRLASFVAQSMPVKPPPVQQPPPAQPAPEEKLLLDAAGKAAQAGEPALAIQLYARLLARFPATLHAVQARAGVELQKKKLAKP